MNYVRPTWTKLPLINKNRQVYQNLTQTDLGFNLQVLSPREKQCPPQWVDNYSPALVTDSVLFNHLQLQNYQLQVRITNLSKPVDKWQDGLMKRQIFYLYNNYLKIGVEY